MPLDDARVIGYGLSSGGGPVRDMPVCEYGLTGSGVDARLATTVRGILPAHLDRNGSGWLPGALMDGRYLVGGFDAFDLQTDQPVSGWHPDVSIGADTTVVALDDAVVLGGSFSFLHGTDVNYAVALDANSIRSTRSRPRSGTTTAIRRGSAPRPSRAAG